MCTRLRLRAHTSTWQGWCWPVSSKLCLHAQSAISSSGGPEGAAILRAPLISSDCASISNPDWCGECGFGRRDRTCQFRRCGFERWCEINRCGFASWPEWSRHLLHWPIRVVGPAIKTVPTTVQLAHGPQPPALSCGHGACSLGSPWPTAANTSSPSCCSLGCARYRQCS